jgi:hypothetical protein
VVTRKDACHCCCLVRLFTQRARARNTVTARSCLSFFKSLLLKKAGNGAVARAFAHSSCARVCRVCARGTALSFDSPDCVALLVFLFLLCLSAAHPLLDLSVFPSPFLVLYFSFRCHMTPHQRRCSRDSLVVGGVPRHLWATSPPQFQLHCFSRHLFSVFFFFEERATRVFTALIVSVSAAVSPLHSMGVAKATTTEKRSW